MHFKDQESTWKLELADWVLKKGSTKCELMVDGFSHEIEMHKGKAEMITVPRGTGNHNIQVSFK
ncbi:MAG: hypothetical protein GH151_00480 [Bacteroidetes bacterium]|nr:hypothetical protein [Bacteroidota bacterium]